MMMNRNISVVLTGRVGPNAHQILKAASIEIRNSPVTTIEDAVRQYLAGALLTIDQAGPPHGGQGRGRNR
jgi:predicted Fe-Mo cluster-binding NifX family protein